MSTPIPVPHPSTGVLPEAFGERLRAAGARIAAAPDGTGSRVLDFGDPGREFAAARAGAVCCPLLDWVAVAVGGADATTFLQGQLTNDVAGLDIGATQWNGWCSPKGRLLANFALARLGPDDYRLLLPADVVAGIVRRLRMFVLRSKVIVTPSDSEVCIGFHGGNDLPQRGRVEERDGAWFIGAPDGRVVAVCSPVAASAVWANAAARATPAGSPVWDWLGIRAGMPVVTAATQDRFVPQMLLWELHGVSFRKGCYPGQEIVARMQYRGRPKERLYRARIAAAAPPPGTSLYSPRFGEQVCGTVVNAVQVPGEPAELLAVLQIASAGDGHIGLTADGAGPSLEILPLPYAVPDSAQAEARS
jgi:folate-binding protein YgfZ